MAGTRFNAVGAAAHSARRVGDSRPHLRLVIKPRRRREPAVRGSWPPTPVSPEARRVDILFGGTTDRADHVRDGRADVALLYAPFDDLTGLEHETLFVEGRVAILPRGHRLASHGELRLADLENETLPRWTGVRWTGVRWTGVLRRPRSGPEIADVPQMIQLILLGRTIAILPRSARRTRPPRAGVHAGDRRADQPAGPRVVAARRPPATRRLIRPRGNHRVRDVGRRLTTFGLPAVVR